MSISLEKGIQRSTEYVMTVAQNVLHLSASALRALGIQVVIGVDASGSYTGMLEGGFVDRILGKFIPWAMTFDADGKADVYPFSDGEDSVIHAGYVTAKTCAGYIKKHVVEKFEGYGCGTDYFWVLQRMLKDFGWANGKGQLIERTAKKSKKGALSGMFGSKNQEPVLVAFHTDGENADKQATRKLLEEMQNKRCLVYVMFVAYSSSKKCPSETDDQFAARTFPFLWEVAKEFSNTGLVVFDDINKWTDQRDDELYTEFFTQEFVNWVHDVQSWVSPD